MRSITVLLLVFLCACARQTFTDQTTHDSSLSFNPIHSYLAFDLPFRLPWTSLGGLPRKAESPDRHEAKGIQERLRCLACR